MPAHLESLNCEVNPDKTYSTDGSSFDESLKEVKFRRHCYKKKKQSLIYFLIHRTDSYFSFWGKCGGTWGGINR